MSSMTVDPNYLPGTSQRLTQNPMLPLHPVTAALDAQYAAAEAINRANTAKQYADILQKLGYTDNQGNFIPGSDSITAQRTADDARFNEAQAVKQVNDTAQQGNAWFSGKRVENIATAEHPYETTIARLGVDLPVQLAQYHEQAAGLIDAYTLQNNKDLADAAARAAQAYTDNPVDTSSSSASGGGTTPPLPGFGGGLNAAQVARNTTGLPISTPGGTRTGGGLVINPTPNHAAIANQRLSQTAARSL